MGRPPCCDKVGIKKGPWTPEEDIILVSYIQEHGPGNWRSVPTNTGLLRCSKSCRLRWTNYLRPGIKRGNFTPHEEGMIIHLQALLGNKWAAIASYLPQRTDNDIKNYWNTHLKKKLKKFQSSTMDPASAPITNQFDIPKCFNERRSLDFNNQTQTQTQTTSSNLKQLNQSSLYASSTENISRLLEGWMRSSPSPSPPKNTNNSLLVQGENNNASSFQCYKPKEEVDEEEEEEEEEGDDNLMNHEEFISILSFENLNHNVGWDQNKSSSTSDNSTTKGSSLNSAILFDEEQKVNIMKQRSSSSSTSHHDQSTPPPLTFLEKWLLDESSTGHVEEINQMMELSSMF